jgi:hypothetical protein
LSPCPCFHVSGIPQTENEITKTATSVYFKQRENRNGNFRLFAANGNRKRTFVFLGQQTLNSKRRLLSANMVIFVYLYLWCQHGGSWSFGHNVGTRAVWFLSGGKLLLVIATSQNERNNAMRREFERMRAEPEWADILSKTRQVPFHTLPDSAHGTRGDFLHLAW